MTFAQFAASVAQGILAVLLPLIVSLAIVGVLVFLARWWLDRRGKS
jgi:hypothetical protein